MKTLKFFTLLIGILFISCSTENVEPSLEISQIEDTTLTRENKPRRVLKIEIPLGRPKHECTGFGFCDWPTISVGCVDESGNSVPCDTPNALVTPNGNQTVNSTVFYEEREGYYFDLSFDVPVDEYNEEELTLEIDETYSLETEEIAGRNLIIQKGRYSYSKSIGKYGGVRVHLKY
ncbi:hypothetical protein [Aquimarina sp. 2201CG5-10]|uniref:hypothetical protein n=1 Tax=Aquimarina callyspongiae TaxID=3098150 RepID=UPI002AB49D97|nr:hypothetical protein [Aquimarina sp. 2201CG5-10]MDY8138404.1 hypothetical protein [Aquimarina sp. 2201CG5-10]